MAARVVWGQTPEFHAYTVDAPVGPWNCTNDFLDVMLVQFFLKLFFDGKHLYSPLGKTIIVDGRYSRTTHYWTFVYKNYCSDKTSNKDSNLQIFRPLTSLTPSFLKHDNSSDLMEKVNRTCSTWTPLQFKDLSVAAGVPPALQACLKVGKVI